jgi:hypothetical protein
VTIATCSHPAFSVNASATDRPNDGRVPYGSMTRSSVFVACVLWEWVESRTLKVK